MSSTRVILEAAAMLPPEFLYCLVLAKDFIKGSRRTTFPAATTTKPAPKAEGNDAAPGAKWKSVVTFLKPTPKKSRPTCGRTTRLSQLFG